LKSIETEKEAICLTPTKAAVENPDRLRSVLKEKAYKSQIVHARHRRHFIDPSIPSTSADERNQENPVTAAKVLSSFRYSEFIFVP
uniref:TPX2_importin domain-containing protein n=1 Tax=Gongylonema pulchrum TaxID=637853 RepID=A0A183DLT4_9BILA